MSAGPPADPELARGALPPAFLERLERILSAEHLERALSSFAAPRAVTLRANTLRATPEELQRALASEGFELERVPWYDAAFALVGRGLRELQESDAHRRGLLYVQGLASMLAPLALDPQPGETVLDLCAAPGSKTTQIACLMRGEGRIVANDRSRKRLYKLRAVLAEQGVEGVEVRCRPGEVIGRALAGRFDRVLVDAPCSSEARFRAGDPQSFADWKPAKIKRLAGEQRRLLLAGLRALRPGGVLVYSTCTFAPEENELVVQRGLRRCAGEVELEELDLASVTHSPGLVRWRERELDPRLARAVRVLPDERTEGFFLARIRRLAP